MHQIHEHNPIELLGPLNAVEEKNAPDRLFLAGDRSLLEQGVRVSVVGSRKASPEGIKRATALARELVQRGITVVSGLAEGIDTSVHEATLHAHGRTIAVLGTPLDRFFPAKNQRLQEVIMRDHLAVSQFAPGTKTHRGHFPMRNRTMALISDATIIVEAGEDSGSLHQGWEALRLGRPLFLLESLLSNPELKWPAQMIHYGAEVLSRDNLEETLFELPSRERGEPLAF